MSRYSKIIAGCMSWGAWGRQFSTQEMISQIKITLESGITTFDHADIYGDYTTEAAFGSAFAQTNITRTQLQLITNCGIQMPCDNRPLPLTHYA